MFSLVTIRLIHCWYYFAISTKHDIPIYPQPVPTFYYDYYQSYCTLFISLLETQSDWHFCDNRSWLLRISFFFSFPDQSWYRACDKVTTLFINLYIYSLCYLFVLFTVAKPLDRLARPPFFCRRNYYVTYLIRTGNLWYFTRWIIYILDRINRTLWQLWYM